MNEWECSQAAPGRRGGAVWGNGEELLGSYSRQFRTHRSKHLNGTDGIRKLIARETSLTSSRPQRPTELRFAPPHPPCEPSGAAHSLRLRYRSGRADEHGSWAMSATVYPRVLKPDETHTHTFRPRLAGIPEQTAVNTCQSGDPGHSRARELHAYKYGHNHP